MGNTRILALSGELDLAAAAAVEEELSAALESGPELIVIDLASLEFIDSSGLSVIVRSHQRAQEAGLQLGLINPRAQVERLLSLTGLTERLILSGSLPDGLSDD